MSGIGSLTSSISQYVDFHIRPLAEQAPSYIKDTDHMLSIADSLNPLPEDELILATFDVSSLYTSIPHDGGVMAMEHFLSKRDCSSFPSLTCLVEFVKLILTCNYFIFQDSWFLQNRGVAMGSPFAPSFAYLYMAFFLKRCTFTIIPSSKTT